MQEKSTVRVRVAFIIQKQDSVLMVCHRKNNKTYWLLPGGGLEFGESVQQCGIREIKEETGLNVKPGKLLFVSESIPPDGHRHVLNLFLSAELIDGELCVGADKVLIDARFIPIKEIPQLTIYPPVKDTLLQYLAHGTVPENAMLGALWD